MERSDANLTAQNRKFYKPSSGFIYYYKVVKVNISLNFPTLSKHILQIHPIKMHILMPKHTKLKPEEADKLLLSLNISLIQLPKIKITDPALPEDAEISDVIKIERVVDGKKIIYYRVVSI